MDQVYETEMVSTADRARFDAAVQKAAASLRAGEVVALPTETVYGLAANGLSGEAVTRIFTIKGRPATNPIILHVANVEMARGLVAEWPKVAQTLAKAFWPGPLTLVLEKAPSIPDRRAERQSFQSLIVDASGACSAKPEWVSPAHRRRRTIADRDRIHGARPYCLTAQGIASRNDPLAIAHTHIPLELEALLGSVSVMPNDPEAFARALYAELHRCDQEGVKLIVVEALPKHPEWVGIEDRLKRASGS